jgi:RecA-family ATPase
MPVSYDDARMGPLERIDLWEQRIPCGDVSLLYGDGAVGKGRMICDLIGRITTGRPLPLCREDTAAEPGSVIVILPEDDPNEQVAHRLRAAGADLSRVYDLTRLDGGSRFKLSADAKHAGDLPHLRALVDQLEAEGRNPRLVVIDPLAAVLGWGTIQTNPGARRLVEPLQDMAKDTGIAVLVVAHTVKSGVLQGSAGLPQALRTVWKISRDPDNPAYRLLTLEKHNNLPDAEPVRYGIEEGADGLVRVAWLDLEALQEQRRGWRDRLAQRQARKAGTVTYSAFTARAGGRAERLAGDAGEDMAKMVCEAKARTLGMTLQWQADGKGGWRAGTREVAFAVAPVRQPRAAV